MIRRPLLWAFAGTILGETAAYLFPGWWSYLAAGAFAAALAALCLYAAGFSTDKNQYLPRSGFSPRIVHVLLPVCFGLGGCGCVIGLGLLVGVTQVADKKRIALDTFGIERGRLNTGCVFFIHSFPFRGLVVRCGIGRPAGVD